MDYLSIIDKYYSGQEELKALLLHHSRQVADKALELCAAHPEWQADTQFVEEAAMLHDIGIFRCNAPGIQCFGDAPYICHGHEGAELLRREGYPRHARVCERHTGAGLTVAEIRQRALPLDVPPCPAGVSPQAWEPFLPETLEEQLICYADKFFSKTRPEQEKTPEQTERSLMKFGEDGVRRFLRWKEMFE